MNPPKEWLVPGSVHPILAVPRELAVTDWMDPGDDQPPDLTLTARTNTTAPHKCAFFCPYTAQCRDRLGLAVKYKLGNSFHKGKGKNPNQPTYVF